VRGVWKQGRIRCENGEQSGLSDLYKLTLGGFVFVSPWLIGFVYGPARLDAWAERIDPHCVIRGRTRHLRRLAATKIHVGAGLICARLAGLELWLTHYNAPVGKARR
jgi:hypothetical protein